MSPDLEALESTTFAGKRFTRKQLAHIQETVKTFPALSRRELGHTICENLRWTTPKGAHRIQACLGALAEMEHIGLIKLPVKRPQKKNDPKAPTLDRQNPGTTSYCGLLRSVNANRCATCYRQRGDCTLERIRRPLSLLGLQATYGHSFTLLYRV